MHLLKLTQIGNSVGIIRSDEVLARLKLGTGESAVLTETPAGYALMPGDPALKHQLAASREFTRDFSDTFHSLAK